MGHRCPNISHLLVEDRDHRLLISAWPQAFGARAQRGACAGIFVPASRSSLLIACLIALHRKEIGHLSQRFSNIDTTKARDLPRLFDVWESSIRATHSFLTEADIRSLSPLVVSELASFKPIHCLRNSGEKPYAFLGVADRKIEMLFVHAENRGNGAGRLLTEFAIQVLDACQVDVNEQNELAIGFYLHLGFRQTHRSPVDSFGNPFPILHLALQ